MSFRTFVKKRPSLALAAAAVMIIGAVVAIVLQARDFGPSGPGKAFFTTDDGQTLFVERATRLPPFDKDGKQAVRAHVFECGGKRVVGYLSAYRPEALKVIEEATAAKAAHKPPPNVQALAAVGTVGLMVKRPGGPWVSQADAVTATAVRVFRCPDGGTPEEIEP